MRCQQELLASQARLSRPSLNRRDLCQPQLRKCSKVLEADEFQLWATAGLEQATERPLLNLVAFRPEIAMRHVSTCAAGSRGLFFVFHILLRALHQTAFSRASRLSPQKYRSVCNYQAWKALVEHRAQQPC